MKAEMKIMKKVSVIIPVFNQEQLVFKAIRSVPTRDDIEIIVIDDCSTDNTYEFLKSFEKDNHLIRLYHNRTNKGVGYTVNRGYSLSKAEYVVLLGSDDYFYRKEFEKCLDELDGTDLVYFNMKQNDGVVWNVNEETKQTFCGSVKFMRREFIGDTRCPELRAREDWYFYQELLKKKPTEKFTGLIVKHYNFPRRGSLTWIDNNS